MRSIALAALSLAALVPQAVGQANAGSVQSFVKISPTQGFGAGAPTVDDHFGHALAYLGDVDGDGVGDIAVGESHDSDAVFNGGAVWVLLLQPGGAIKSKIKITPGQNGFVGPLQSSDEFGSAVGGPGDIDGDSIPDLAVGEWSDDDGGSGRGAVWILFLNANGTVKSEQKISDTQGGFTGLLDNGDGFGISLAGIGDRDNDGTPDLAVGARFDDDGGLNRGALWVLKLLPSGQVKSHEKISDTAGGFTGTLKNDDVFGSGVAGIGDLDKDGVVDVAVGAMQDDDGGSNNGAVWMLFMRPNNSPVTVKAHQKISALQGSFAGPLNNDQFGSTVAPLDDYDGDGVIDLAVGARLDGPATPGGTIWLLLLREDGTVKQSYPISEIDGNFPGQLASGDEFANSIASLGDHDGDGIVDLAVGAWLDDDGGQNSGSIYMLHLGQTCPDQSLVYGTGCPGSGGFVPTLNSIDCPIAGGALTLAIDQAFGGTTATLLLGFGQSEVPFGFSGCSLNITPVLPLSISVALGGFGPGTGNATVFAGAPPSVSGLTVTMQAFIPDPGPVIGFANSNGLQLKF